MGIPMSEVKSKKQCVHFTSNVNSTVYLHGMSVPDFNLCNSCNCDWIDYDSMVESKRYAHAHKKDNAKLDIRQLLQQMSEQLDKL